MSDTPRVDYQTHPSRYRHWKLAVDGRVADTASRRVRAGLIAQLARMNPPPSA